MDITETSSQVNGSLVHLTLKKIHASPRLYSTTGFTVAAARLPLYRASRLPSSPPPRHASHVRTHHPTAAVVSTAGTVCALSPGPHSRPPAPILLCTATAQPGSRYAVLRPPDCHVLLKAFVASVCFECFTCFRGMLQVFQMDVVKIDWAVAYVAIVVHACFKLLFSILHLFFDVCCKCGYLDVAYVFTHMLQVFYPDVAYVLQWLSSVFMCFLQVFIHMLQVFQLLFWMYVACV